MARAADDTMPSQPDDTYQFNLPHRFDADTNDVDHSHDGDHMEDVVESTENQSFIDNSHIESGSHGCSRSHALSEDSATLSDHDDRPDEREGHQFEDMHGVEDALSDRLAQADSYAQGQRDMPAPLIDSNNGRQPYQSLFGGPSLFGDPAEDTVSGHFGNHTSTEGPRFPDSLLDSRPTATYDVPPVEPLTPGFGLRRGMSDFHLGEQEEDDSSSERSFGRRPGLNSSDIGSSSPRASAPSSDDGYFYIPPDDRVSLQ